jgi:hypothetical protein
MVREKEKRTHRRSNSIWDTQHMKEILAQPVGTPMDLTPEEAKAVIREVLDGSDRTNTETYRRRVREVRQIRRESGALLVRPSADD